MNIVKELLNIGAIKLNIEQPFTWASGILSPIYCDNRKSIGHYNLRKNIATQLTQLIKTHFPEVEIIGGTATAGIPHATSVADNLELPMVYFRSKPKDHGTNSTIEGDFKEGNKIVIVEDLISTGGSVLKCVENARLANMQVLGIVSIFNYEMQSATDNLNAANIKNYSVTSFSALENELNLSSEQKAFLDKWKKNPTDKSIWNTK